MAQQLQQQLPYDSFLAAPKRNEIGTLVLSSTDQAGAVPHPQMVRSAQVFTPK